MYIYSEYLNTIFLKMFGTQIEYFKMIIIYNKSINQFLYIYCIHNCSSFSFICNIYLTDLSFLYFFFISNIELLKKCIL